MGTRYSIKVLTDSSTEALLQQRIDWHLHRIDELMSTYRNDSELMRFNLQQSTLPFALSKENQEVFNAALTLSQISQGAFDITVLPLVEAWGFGPKGRRTQNPSTQTLQQLKSFIGYQHLNLRDGFLMKDHPNVACDLSAIAPGYAADAIAKEFKARNIKHFLIDIGGEIVTQGLNEKQHPWRVAVENPLGEQQTILHLNKQAVATSGDYRNFFMRDGKRFSHTIDPRTFKPIEHDLAAVTVIHPNSAMWADGFATVFMVLGKEQAKKIAELYGLGVLFITRNKQNELEVESNALFKTYGTMPTHSSTQSKASPHD